MAITKFNYIDLDDLQATYGYVPNKNIENNVKAYLEFASERINTLSGNQIQEVGLDNLTENQINLVKKATCRYAWWLCTQAQEWVIGSMSVSVEGFSVSQTAANIPDYVVSDVFNLLQQAGLYIPRDYFTPNEKDAIPIEESTHLFNSTTIWDSSSYPLSVATAFSNFVQYKLFTVTGGTLTQGLSLDNKRTWNLAITGGTGGQVNSIVAGTNITVDATDPINPIVNSSSGTNFTPLPPLKLENGNLILTANASNFAVVNQALNLNTNITAPLNDNVAFRNEWNNLNSNGGLLRVESGGLMQIATDNTGDNNVLTLANTPDLKGQHLAWTSGSALISSNSNAIIYYDATTYAYTIDVATTGGQVNSVVAGQGITVNNSDPINPVITAINSGSGSGEDIFKETSVTLNYLDEFTLSKGDDPTIIDFVNALLFTSESPVSTVNEALSWVNNNFSDCDFYFIGTNFKSAMHFNNKIKFFKNFNDTTDLINFTMQAPLSESGDLNSDNNQYLEFFSASGELRVYLFDSETTANRYNFGDGTDSSLVWKITAIRKNLLGKELAPITNISLNVGTDTFKKSTYQELALELKDGVIGAGKEFSSAQVQEFLELWNLTNTSNQSGFINVSDLVAYLVNPGHSAGDIFPSFKVNVGALPGAGDLREEALTLNATTTEQIGNVFKVVLSHSFVLFGIEVLVNLELDASDETIMFEAVQDTNPDGNIINPWLVMVNEVITAKWLYLEIERHNDTVTSTDGLSNLISTDSMNSLEVGSDKLLNVPATNSFMKSETTFTWNSSSSLTMIPANFIALINNILISGETPITTLSQAVSFIMEHYFLLKFSFRGDMTTNGGDGPFTWFTHKIEFVKTNQGSSNFDLWTSFYVNGPLSGPPIPTQIMRIQITFIGSETVILNLRDGTSNPPTPLRFGNGSVARDWELEIIRDIA